MPQHEWFMTYDDYLKEVLGPDERQGTGKIHELPIVGLPDNAKPRADRGPLPGTRSLAGAKPVNLEPLAGRGEPAGLLPGENFNAERMGKRKPERLDYRRTPHRRPWPSAARPPHS